MISLRCNNLTTFTEIVICLHKYARNSNRGLELETYAYTPESRTVMLWDNYEGTNILNIEIPKHKLKYKPEQ